MDCSFSVKKGNTEMKINRLKQKMWQRIAYRALNAMNIGRGGDVESSGEIFTLKYVCNGIISDAHPVIFDVGANVGDYTKEVLKISPDASIHCFEPSRETFRRLQKNITSSNVYLNNFGISDAECTRTLYSDKEGSGLASLYNRRIDYWGVNMGQTESVKIRTIDSYCEEYDISTIDFLKMDIEGNEFKALLGAQSMIDKGGVNAIQIEFGGCNIDSKTYFKDFWYLLNDKYDVYRILQKGLYKIEKYNEFLEIFLNTNYLFVKREC